MEGLYEVRNKDGYYDQKLNTRLISVVAGSCHWTEKDGFAFSTTLGSCLSVCVCDPTIGVGGMNHFMLPEQNSEGEEVYSRSFRYGSAAIESLLNALYQKGAAKNGLIIKVFGGASVLKKINGDIGQRNIDFMKRFFQRENLRLASEDVGGFSARRIVFFPKTGKVLVKHLASEDFGEIMLEEQRVLARINNEKVESDVELF